MITRFEVRGLWDEWKQLEDEGAVLNIAEFAGEHCRHLINTIRILYQDIDQYTIAKKGGSLGVWTGARFRAGNWRTIPLPPNAVPRTELKEAESMLPSPEKSSFMGKLFARFFAAPLACVIVGLDALAEVLESLAGEIILICPRAGEMADRWESGDEDDDD